MRQKADKLEKGKWYCDLEVSDFVEPTFFRFEKFDEGGDQIFDILSGDPYKPDPDGKFTWDFNSHWYLPTPEDIEKYNLNEE